MTEWIVPVTRWRTEMAGRDTNCLSPIRKAQRSPVAMMLSLVFAAVLVAAPGVAQGQEVDYRRDVKPLLERRCYSCHSRLKQKGDLRLDAGILAHKGGRHGSVLERDAAGISPLIQKITSTDPEVRMPLDERPLAPEEIALLRRWIESSAPFPKDEPVPIAPGDHWAFQPVRRPRIPTVAMPGWPRNPIDAFVLAQSEAHGLRPGPEADFLALLRRVYLDLTGVPPTPAEQDAFSRDPSDAALDRVIEELLGRPAYGQRWARHWLDVVRYADSNGYERDAEKPMVWRYRDYVIDAFNRDKPYDRFLTEQLAGDEVPDASAETVIATGYLRLGNWDDEPADPATDRYDQLDDIVSTTSQAFLGLTLGCARCHDHKFEPLTTRDYYSMVSVFAPLSRPQNGRTELTRPAGSPARVAEYQRLQRELELATKASGTPDAAARQPLQERLRNLGGDLPEGYFLFEPTGASPVSHVLLRGNPSRPGDRVEPAVPAVLVRQQPAFPKPDAWTSHRRLGLAQWIASPSNPLTARVMVNRVWQQHFGVGLVRTANDFGIMGEPPGQPELLDWLSDWFVHEGGWSMKALHRMILGSRTWRLSRAARTESMAADPDNRWLTHPPYRRLEVEALRDSILAVSGQLDLRAGGRGVFLPIPAAALEANSDRDSIWTAGSEAETSRRTVYAFIKRGLVVPLLEVLDLCDTVSSTPQRQVTTVAPQALTLFNGDFVHQQARRFAGRLKREAGSDPERQVELAIRLALCRPPTSVERKTLLEFLGPASGMSPDQGLEQVCRVLFNLNEFAYPE